MHFFAFDLLNLWFSDSPGVIWHPPRLFGTREYVSFRSTLQTAHSFLTVISALKCSYFVLIRGHSKIMTSIGFYLPPPAWKAHYIGVREVHYISQGRWEARCEFSHKGCVFANLQLYEAHPNLVRVAGGEVKFTREVWGAPLVELNLNLFLHNINVKIQIYTQEVIY